MSSYEHTVIARPELSEKDSESLIKKYQDIINNNSGKVIKIEQWGLRTFSHSIKNNRKGFYFHIKFDGSGETVGKLEKMEIIDSSLLRFLTVKVKKHDLEKNYFENKVIKN